MGSADWLEHMEWFTISAAHEPRSGTAVNLILDLWVPL